MGKILIIGILALLIFGFIIVGINILINEEHFKELPYQSNRLDTPDKEVITGYYKSPKINLVGVS